MGFKRVDINELEFLLSPSFVGIPIKHIEKVVELEKSEEKVKISNLESSDLYLFNEDNLEYSLDNQGNLINFLGTGFISVVNHSRKDRIWDARLKITGLEHVDLKGDHEILIGNLEPETNKKFNYNILKSKNLPQPIKITEEIEILNLEEKSDVDFVKSPDFQEIEDEKNIDTTDKEIESELKKEQELQYDISKTLEDYNKKRDQIMSVIKSLNEAKNTYINAKSRTVTMNLKKLSKDSKILEDVEYNSSVREIKSKIEKDENEIKRINDEYLKKENGFKKETEINYNPKIKGLQSKLDTEQIKKEDAIKIESDLINKDKDLSLIIKDLRKEVENLNAEKSKISKKSEENEAKKLIKEIEPKLKNKDLELQKKLEEQNELIKKLNEWAENKKNYIDNVKVLEQEINSLEKEKNKELKSKINEVLKERDKKINTFEKAIKEKEDEINNLNKRISKQSSVKKKTENKFDPKIENIESKLSANQNKLEEINKKLLELTKEDNQIAKNIKNIEKKLPKSYRSNDKPELYTIYDIIDETKRKKNYILLFNKNNSLKYSLSLSNNTNFLIKNVKFTKLLSKDFSNFQFKKSGFSEVEIIQRNVFWKINEIKPGETVELVIFTELYPKEKKVIGTGDIQLVYEIADFLVSGVEIADFSAYSHAMHAIRITEKDIEPYKWDCSLFFKNNSDINMELKSILVLDKDRKNKFIDFHPDKDKIIVTPGESYYTEKWEVSSEDEPKFHRKLDYSITYKTKKRSQTILKVEEEIFEIVDTLSSKKFSKTEIKSFEKAEIENRINVKNTGSVDINGILIEEVIPIDFIPPLNASDISIRNSSGIIDRDCFLLKIIPEDDDPLKNHSVQLILKGKGEKNNRLIKVNDFIELKYNFFAIKPSFKTKYEFPLKLTTFFAKYKDRTTDSADNYYKITNNLANEMLPKINVIHKRRNIIISKAIFPGRETDEFGISVSVINKSNVEINDIKITDTISKYFELVSSNFEAEILKTDDKNKNILSFTISSILPYQEKEIRYYIQNKSGKEIGYDELESYIFG